MSARRLLKELAWKATAASLKTRNILDWPAWAANLFEIKLPSNTIVNEKTSSSGGANINVILDLMNECKSIPGDIAECGVYRGSTLISMALFLQQIGSEKKVFGFDSFQGFDDHVETDLNLGGQFDQQKRRGGFGNTSRSFVQKRLNILDLNHVELVSGFFEKSLEKFSERQYSFVHLDCDIYESYHTCLNYLYPRLSGGGIMLLDEYDDPPWPGCNLAVDEFLTEHSIDLHAIVRDGHRKFYLRRDAWREVSGPQANPDA